MTYEDYTRLQEYCKLKERATEIETYFLSRQEFIEFFRSQGNSYAESVYYAQTSIAMDASILVGGCFIKIDPSLPDKPLIEDNDDQQNNITEK